MPKVRPVYLILILLLIAIALVFFSPLVLKTLAKIPKTNTINEPVIISAPGHYTLKNNLIDCPKLWCIAVFSSDVVIDGMGHLLEGDYLRSSRGIQIGQSSQDLNNITIRNLSVNGFTFGINAFRVHNLTIDSVTVGQNTKDLNILGINRGPQTGIGIYYSFVSTSLISNSWISENENHGIYSLGSSDITIQNNTVNNNLKYGIFLSSTSNGNISHNIIQNNEKGIFLQHDSDATQLSNELTPDKIAIPASISVIIGTLLIWLFRSIYPASNAVAKLAWGKITECTPKSLAITSFITSSFKSGLLHLFFENTLLISTMAAITLGFSFFIMRPHIENDLFSLSSFILLGVTAGVLPKLAQYVTAKHYGIESKYQLWLEGIAIMLFTSGILKFVFSQPLKTKISNSEQIDDKQLIIIIFSGSVASFIILLSFIGVYMISTQRQIQWLALTGLEMGMLTMLISLMPFSPMEGEKVLKWNKKLWAIVFFLILSFYLYLFVLY